MHSSISSSQSRPLGEHLKQHNQATFMLLLESRRTDAGECANPINALAASLATRALAIVNVFLTEFPTEAIGTLTEIRDGA